MKVSIVTFFLIFALVEFYQWIKQFTVPVPIFVFAGAFLAIASNSEKGITAWFAHKKPLESVLQQTATLVDSTPILESQKAQTEEN